MPSWCRGRRLARRKPKPGRHSIRRWCFCSRIRHQQQVKQKIHATQSWGRLTLPRSRSLSLETAGMTDTSGHCEYLPNRLSKKTWKLCARLEGLSYSIACCWVRRSSFLPKTQMRLSTHLLEREARHCLSEGRRKNEPSALLVARRRYHPRKRGTRPIAAACPGREASRLPVFRLAAHEPTRLPGRLGSVIHRAYVSCASEISYWAGEMRRSGVREQKPHRRSSVLESARYGVARD